MPFLTQENMLVNADATVHNWVSFILTNILEVNVEGESCSGLFSLDLFWLEAIEKTIHFECEQLDKPTIGQGATEAVGMVELVMMSSNSAILVSMEGPFKRSHVLRTENMHGFFVVQILCFCTFFPHCSASLRRKDRLHCLR